MTYTRITALWSGGLGGPGCTRLRFRGDLDSAGALQAANRVRAFFVAIASQIPAGVNITFSEAAQRFNDQHQLSGEVAYVPPGGVAGTAAGNYASPVGMVVNWLTGSFHGGRKERGRTFLVPLGGAAFSGDGTPSGAAVTQVANAAQGLAGGAPPLVLAVGSVARGYYGTVDINGASVPDRSAILRSRRD